MGLPVLLCIDERPQLLELRKATFEPLGYCVEIATSGDAALQMLEEIPVAAVLIEYKSEGMGTEAVAFHIRQRFPNEPIILLSACSDLPERVLWWVDEYVMKSEPLDGLAKVIERVTHPSLKATARK